MANIDMIPRSYREARRARRLLRGYGMALAGVLLAGAAASAFLHWRLSVELPRLEALRGSTARLEAARTHLAVTQLRKNALSEDVAALGALRGVGALGRLADALDATLNERVWLERMVFTRTLERIEGAPALDASAPGLVLRARPAPSAAEGVAWRLVDKVEMGGGALDHAALSAFLNRTEANGPLHALRFLQSSVATGEEGQSVAFSIAGPLGPAGGQP
ncbi:hypothetical protein LQ564_22855 [Massilia sp. G4R7]|uniref:Type IV pilus assembly protein PilN n=1 Tax=Massilia phyllostachyos TaxID=2898585 RepID=A0ABS8QBK2_9BURK|nr:hypothetical protein [Massilia phyllostachyos]MCD2519146.1 hypothetical protein [Massilia phyllostachyos]